MHNGALLLLNHLRFPGNGNELTKLRCADVVPGMVSADRATTSKFTHALIPARRALERKSKILVYDCNAGYCCCIHPVTFLTTFRNQEHRL